MNEPLAYRVKDFARLTGLSESTIKRLIYSGQIKGLKIGRSMIIPAEAVKEFLAGQSQNETRNQAESLITTA